MEAFYRYEMFLLLSTVLEIPNMFYMYYNHYNNFNESQKEVV